MNYPYLEQTGHMRPRQNRSNPYQLIIVDPLPDAFAGSLTESKAAQWKPASANTYVELAMKGSLSIGQMRDAFDRGRLTAKQFKRAFWSHFDPEVKITKETIAIIRNFSPVLI